MRTYVVEKIVGPWSRRTKYLVCSTSDRHTLMFEKAQDIADWQFEEGCVLYWDI